ncbi:MAG: hypothetical protein HYW50_01720 [Candidatus Diapherotrites archaeon]|nr:hypothetical protein [Candidatus Diapherotrites archaeon]
MKWKVIVEDDKVNLFPFIYWPDAYSSGWKEIIGKNLQNTLLEFRNSKFRYCIDKMEWKEMAEMVFSRIKNSNFGEKIIEMNKESVLGLYNYCREIHEKDFSFHTNAELKEVNENYSKKMIEANRAGLFISILEYENNILSDNLENYLKEQREKIGLQINVPEAFAMLITPRKDNFTQQEIENYHKLLKEFKENKKIVQRKNDSPKRLLGFIEKSFPKFFEKIRQHAKNYCWIRYNYEGPAFTEKELAQKLANDTISGKKIPKRISKEELAKEQEKLAERLKIDEKHRRLFSLTMEYMYWKTLRRDVQSFAFFVFETFQNEVVKRFGFSLKETRQLHYNEMNALLDGKKIEKESLQERQKHSVYILENGKTSLLSGNDALEKSREIQEEELDLQAKILKGNCAMPGKVVGFAKVINTQDQFFKLQENDILVSFATTPDMTAIIKKAGAIVTDQGGITCHAAIISRELKIPCVVGTKIATKIIKDGERIEVDASDGTVKRLED